MIKSVKRTVKNVTVEKPKKKRALNQEELVLNYLIDVGKKGATNFEMMMALRMCDVRKRISEISKWVIDYSIVSLFETSENGKTYKRYWAMPIEYNNLAEWLYETKRPRKIAKKRTGGGFR